ncbi:MAG TPA: sensor histidine kinase [Burkholderiaceae bacterium]|nr:sensor histidine kinase [Burkholderiaceae bacterium]
MPAPPAQSSAIVRAVFAIGTHCPLRARVALLLWWALALVILAAAPARAVQIRAVEWTLTAPGATPTPDARWIQFDLPHRWSAGEGAVLQGVAMRLRFTLQEVPTDAWAILLGIAPNGGRVTINGRFVGAIPMPDKETHVRWRRPHLLAIDPTLLAVGSNEILIQTAYRSGTHTLSGVEVGRLMDLSPRYELQFFQSYTMAWIGASVAAVITLLFGVLWIRRREALLGLLTAAAGLWVLRSSYFLLEAVPIELQTWIRLVYYLSNGGFAAVSTMALLRLSGRQTQRVDWLLGFYALLGPALFLLTGGYAAPYLDQFWLPGLLIIPTVALGFAIAARMRRPGSPPIAVLIAAAIALLAGVHDFLLLGGNVVGSSALALHWGVPLLLIALATPLTDRFVRALREAETARDELESRVREREQLLKRNFERLRESERAQAQAQERQRIMQDMHDGLGSQLLSSLMLVERKGVSQEQVVQILRECMDDMRLAIDAMAAEDAGLLSALGNLRFRMEPRLRAAGLELAWTARGLPEEIDIHPDAVLPILRIVQEALTNALKHSRARTVQVVIALEQGGDAPWLNIRVADNGRGITQEGVGGRGLLNMRNRAQRIGAQLKIESVPSAGTLVQLRFKIEPQETTTMMRTQMPLNTQAVIERVRQGST